MNKPFDWGKVYYAALRRGEDHGAAAMIADRAEYLAKQRAKK